MQFAAQTTFQVLLAVPVVGAALLVAMILGADLANLLQGSIRDIGSAVADALMAEPIALGAFVVAGAGAITGQLIGWDPVVPDGATAADDGARGMFDAVAGDVRVVVVGGAEVDPGVLLRWTLVHVVVVSAVAVILGRLLWLRLQAWTAAEEEDGNQTVER